MVLTRKQLEEVFDKTKECGDCLQVYKVRIDSSGIIKIVCPYDNDERFTNFKCKYLQSKN